MVKEHRNVRQWTELELVISPQSVETCEALGAPETSQGDEMNDNTFFDSLDDTHFVRSSCGVLMLPRISKVAIVDHSDEHVGTTTAEIIPYLNVSPNYLKYLKLMCSRQLSLPPKQLCGESAGSYLCVSWEAFIFCFDFLLVVRLGFWRLKMGYCMAIGELVRFWMAEEFSQHLKFPNYIAPSGES
jgi:hypothetical protein